MAAIKSNILITLYSTAIDARIKPTYIAELKQCADVTGMSVSQLLNEAIDTFIETQAPIYMHAVDPAAWNWLKRPRVRRA